MLGLKKSSPKKSAPPLDVSLAHPVADSELRVLNADGVELLFEVSSCPDLAIGQVVDLRVSGDGLPDVLTVSSVVHQRVEGEGDRRFDFRFLDPAGFKSALPDELRQVIEHRHAYRMPPEPSSPVDVAVHAPSLSIRAQAWLVDISTSGIGIAVTAGVEAELREMTKLELSFRLPPSHELIKIIGRVRHRRLASDGIRYGIAFDEGLTEDFPACLTLVQEFIRSRQAQLVQDVLNQ